MTGGLSPGLPAGADDAGPPVRSMGPGLMKGGLPRVRSRGGRDAGNGVTPRAGTGRARVARGMGGRRAACDIVGVMARVAGIAMAAGVRPGRRSGNGGVTAGVARAGGMAKATAPCAPRPMRGIPAMGAGARAMMGGAGGAAIRPRGMTAAAMATALPRGVKGAARGLSARAATRPAHGMAAARAGVPPAAGAVRAGAVRIGAVRVGAARTGTGRTGTGRTGAARTGNGAAAERMASGRGVARDAGSPGPLPRGADGGMAYRPFFAVGADIGMDIGGDLRVDSGQARPAVPARASQPGAAGDAPAMAPGQPGMG
ncbi:hypothetical protein CFR76_04645, partial [Komagataeibacter swingsii]